MKRLFRCAGIIGLSAIANAIFAQDSGVIGPSPYEFTTQTWIEPFAQEGFTWGGNSGVHVESEDRIFFSAARRNTTPGAFTARIHKLCRLSWLECTSGTRSNLA